MTHQDEINYLNSRISLLKNLVWLASGILFATAGVAAWTWVQLTDEFVKYDDELRIRHVGSTAEVYLGFSPELDSSGRNLAVARVGEVVPWKLERTDPK